MISSNSYKETSWTSRRSCEIELSRPFPTKTIRLKSGKFPRFEL